MSQVTNCPTCGSKSRIKEKGGNTIYEAVQNEEAFNKIGQMKKAIEKYKVRAEKLEKELKQLNLS
ncbi:hypothetical protein [Kriegella aquimaris]|uniref:Uncharacterized protein n=1 Tax=Kriegella aquimaris TaxID=192904 RepID=A0A1G9JC65_9FLAO|nr:hypothetical protein [Kriegella aquimaris]SDL34882.1 hypothetical protein SAMN04488514_101488 [Kriegella aquimaris]